MTMYLEGTNIAFVLQFTASILNFSVSLKPQETVRITGHRGVKIIRRLLKYYSLAGNDRPAGNDRRPKAKLFEQGTKCREKKRD